MGMKSTPSGISREVGPEIKRTECPRFAAAAARAYPIFPEDRFVRYRTGSMDSIVGPAVMRTFMSGYETPSNE